MRLAFPVLSAMAVIFISAAPAFAQVTQVINFPAGQIGGAWASGGCGTGNERGSSTVGAAMNLVWTDTTNAPASSVVQIQIDANWKFWCSGGGYTVAINGTDMGAGTTPSNTNNCLCNASAFGSTTQVVGPGSFNWNTGGSNTLSFTISGAAWIGIMDNTDNPAWSARLTVTLLNQAPADPVNLGQINAAGQGIGVGGTAGPGMVTLRATVSDPDFDEVFLEAEVLPPTVFFPGTPNYVGAPAPSGTFATIGIPDLVEGPYHWRLRAVDEFDVVTQWISFGNNPEIVPDFFVSSASAVPKPLDGKNHGGGDCNLAAGAALGSPLIAVAGLALIAYGLVRRRR